MKKILIMGTLDTKGEQLAFLRDRIRARGHEAVLMDFSLGARSSVRAQIGTEELVALGGGEIEAFRRSRDRAANSEIILRGAREKLKALAAGGGVDGAVALGGASMAIMGATVMGELPFGTPKLIATPAAMPAYLSEWFRSMDIAVMQVILEFTGMNGLLRRSIAQAAGAISGMAEEASAPIGARPDSSSVAITEIGFCPKCSHSVERLLAEKGYDVFTFHAQGISEKAMDRLLGQGAFGGLIDIVPAGLIEEMYGGNRAGGLERLDEPLAKGVPIVLAPCTLNLTGCGPTRKNGDSYRSRERILKIDELRAMTRYNPEELRAGARAYAEKLNSAAGPVRFLFPLKGWSAIDAPGGVLHDPEGDRVFMDALRAELKPSVEVVTLECNLEEEAFARALVDSFEELRLKAPTPR